MKITKTTISSFSVPFKKEILGQGPVKEGFYFEIETKNKKGKGELSYYKGLHPQSPKELLSELKSLRLEGLTLTLDKLDFHKPFFNLLDREPLPGQLQFCIESALLGLISPHKAFPHSKSQSQTLILLSQSLPKEYTPTVKVKIGRDSLDKEIELLKKIPGILRLDGNLSLTKEDVELFFNEFKDRIDYFEDPFTFSVEWKELSQKGIPLALDENFQDHLDEDLSFLKALIVKPSLCKGLYQVFKLIDQSCSNIILSSTFETKVGIGALEKLACYQGFPAGRYHGLGTLCYLERH